MFLLNLSKRRGIDANVIKVTHTHTHARAHTHAHTQMHARAHTLEPDRYRIYKADTDTNIL